MHCYSIYTYCSPLILSCDCQVTEQIEGEARRYYEHAITLRNTLKFLRHNPSLIGAVNSGGSGLGVDLLRLESMASLDPGTLRRVLQKNYRWEEAGYLIDETKFVASNTSMTIPHVSLEAIMCVRRKLLLISIVREQN